MSLASLMHRKEFLRSEEPFKKRFKVQITAADLCKVVIDNSSDEEKSEKGYCLTSSDEEYQYCTDSSEDSENEVEDSKCTNWFEKTQHDGKKVDFREATGLKALPLSPQPRDFFNLMMNKSMYNMVIRNTNAYMHEAVKNKKDAKTSSWKALGEDEFTKFLGLLFLMGVIQLPDISLYWSNDVLFNFHSFRQIMTLNRFLAILHSLRFCDNSSSDSVEPLKKIRPLMDFFNKLMESIYTPEKELVMDNPITIEGPLEGRLKVFTLSEPCGMVLKYLIQKSNKGEQANYQGRYTVAKKLLEGKLGKGHSVYMGEYFTSIPLIEALKVENTYATGKLSEARRKHYEILWKSFRKANFFHRFTSEGVCLLKWKEKQNEIVCVSSEFDGSLTETIHRQKVKLEPLALVELNTHLLPRSNIQELVAPFHSGNKKIKWYKRLVLEIIYMIMINSYHLYNRCPLAKKMSLVEFKLNLIKALLYSGNETENSQPLQSHGRFAKPHVLDYVGRNDKGFRKRKRCKYCITEKGVRVDSYYHCITCDTQPGFCLGQCFIKYHKYDLT